MRALQCNSPAQPGAMAEDGAPKVADETDSGAFEALEHDFQEVLQELVGDKSLQRFRTEYEKLHRAEDVQRERETADQEMPELNARLSTTPLRYRLPSNCRRKIRPPSEN